MKLSPFEEYNAFAQSHSPYFRRFTTELLKDAAKTLSNRDFDTLVVDLEGWYSDVEVEVEVAGWLPWRKRTETRNERRYISQQRTISSGWYLTCLTRPDERESISDEGYVETQYRDWLLLEPSGCVRHISVEWEYVRFSSEAVRRNGRVYDLGTIDLGICDFTLPPRLLAGISNLGLLGLDMPCPKEIDHLVPGGSKRSFYRQPRILELPMVHHLEYLVERCLARREPEVIKNADIRGEVE